MAFVIFISTPMLASFIVAAITTFLSHYCGLLDSLIAAGIGPGMWGIKLNAALISSTGQLWHKLRALFTYWLPAPHDVIWLQVRYAQVA